jgi:hypothetical protein
MPDHTLQTPVRNGAQRINRPLAPPEPVVRDKRAAGSGEFFGMLPVVHQVFGAVLIVVGIILTPTPIPFGLILLTIGFALLAPYIPAFQRLVRHMRGKWPKLDEQLRRWRDRLPPVIRSTIDKTHPTPAE